MAIGVRDITNLEELLEVQDNDKIVVVQNGEAKLVSKANAKFGGGSVIIFYADAAEPARIKRLVDSDGNPISAQTAYDAVMSGQVYINFGTIEGHNIIFVPIMFGITKNGIEIISVAFRAIDNGKNIDFYAGANPSVG